jgi:hypothetical protein
MDYMNFVSILHCGYSCPSGIANEIAWLHEKDLRLIFSLLVDPSQLGIHRAPTR